MAEPGAAVAGSFERDTAVRRTEEGRFAAEVSPDWRAGRGPHGGYLAAILLRALIGAVDEPGRAPRSLTTHYLRPPEPGPVEIEVRLEREGRSLSTLSARMEQDGRTSALVLAAFSVPWRAPEIADLPMPAVAPADPDPQAGRLLHPSAPPFTRHMVLQPRFGAMPFSGSAQPMEVGGWIGLAEERPLDAPAIAFFSDALFSPPFVRLHEPGTSPTIDLTIHFRTPLPHPVEAERGDLCLARFTTGLLREGFFEEDGTIWAPDGTVLAQSRQLAVLLPLPAA